MKKLALAAVVMLVASLGTVAASTGAQAADPYPGNIPTNCRLKIDNHAGKGKATRVLGLVEVPASRLHAKGTVKIVVKRKNGTVLYVKTIDLSSGRLAKDFTPRFKGPGPYFAKIKFSPRAGTVFLGCSKAGQYRL
jgi:hypothetical protein